MWAYFEYRELDLGFIPGKYHAPPSISVGTAEVGGAYRKPRSSVKSQSALLTFRTGQLAVSMGDRPGRQGVYTASGECRASSTGT